MTTGGCVGVRILMSHRWTDRRSLFRLFCCCRWCATILPGLCVWCISVTDGLTWAGELHGRGEAFCCYTVPQSRSWLNTGRIDPPHWALWGLFYRNSGATVQMFTEYSCFLQGTVNELQWFPLSQMFHLQCTSAVIGSSHQPDIIRLWTESRASSVKKQFYFWNDERQMRVTIFPQWLFISL